MTQGAEVYADQCAACHGTFGEGEGRYPKLAGGEGTLRRPSRADRWQLLAVRTDLWDYINRAMPFPGAAHSVGRRCLCLTAYILNLNNIVPKDFVADRDTLPKVKMPNHDRFIVAGSASRYGNQGLHEELQDPEDVKIVRRRRARTSRRGQRVRLTTCNRSSMGASAGSMEKSMRSGLAALTCFGCCLEPVRLMGSRTGTASVRRQEACVRSQQGQLPHMSRDQRRRFARQSRAAAQRHEGALSGPQGIGRDRLGRDQAQSADGHAAVRPQPHSDRKRNQQRRRFSVHLDSNSESNGDERQ